MSPQAVVDGKAGSLASMILPGSSPGISELHNLQGPPMEWSLRGGDLPALFLVHFPWQVCPTLWAAGLGVGRVGRESFYQTVLGKRTEVTASEPGCSFTHERPTACILAQNRIGGTARKKSQFPNGNLTVENESFSNISYPPLTFTSFLCEACSQSHWPFSSMNLRVLEVI